MFKILENTPLFKKMKLEDITSLISSNTHTMQKFIKESYIAYRGEEIPGILIVINGSIQAEMLDDNGNVFPIEMRKPGDLVAPAFIFGSGEYPVDLRVVSDAVILVISKVIFTEMLQSNTQLLQNFLTILSKNMSFLSNKIYFNFNHKTIEDKFMAYLQAHSEDRIAKITMNIEELAQFFQVSRPSLSRVIAKLIEDKYIIKLSKNNFKILKPHLKH